jgi:hypothetical protein
MNANQQLRDELVHGAEAAYIELMRQLDFLFDQASFYLQRYPCNTVSDVMKTVELSTCISFLGRLPSDLADVVKCWKQGIPTSISRDGVELDLLNEIWANVQGLIYFLVSHDISLDPFNIAKTTEVFYILVRANRSLT